jgi:hypothetical protein
MAEQRRTRMAALAALYTTSGTGGVIAVTSLLLGDYLVWVVGILVSVKLLLGARWLSTGHRPWRKRHPHRITMTPTGESGNSQPPDGPHP